MLNETQGKNNLALYSTLAL